MALISASHLGKQFDDFWAVSDFTLEVAQGEVVAVLGPNGAGKTTTVRMLASVLRPTRGSARVAGYDVAQHGVQVRRHVGVLTEQHGLYTRMPAAEYLDFFGQVYGLDADLRGKRIEKWMDYFGLWPVRHRRIGTFSKGMRQKLALARALLHEPRVLLLDEPTSAMDPESAGLVREAIRHLRSEERAILLCTHNLYEAESLADRIAIMYQGEIITVGTPRELKRRWLGVQGFEATLTQPPQGEAWERARRAFPPRVEVQHVDVRGMRLFFRSPEWRRDNPVVVKALVDAGFGVIRIADVEAELEQVYLEVMRHVQTREA